jgi:hypothetical protein
MDIDDHNKAELLDLDNENVLYALGHRRPKVEKDPKVKKAALTQA